MNSNLRVENEAKPDKEQVGRINWDELAQGRARRWKDRQTDGYMIKIPTCIQSLPLSSESPEICVLEMWKGRDR